MATSLSAASEYDHSLVNEYLKKYYEDNTLAAHLNKEILLYFECCRYFKDDVRPILLKLGYGLSKINRGRNYITHAMSAIHLLLLSAIPVDDIVDGLDNEGNLEENELSKKVSLAYSLSTKMREDARLILLKQYKSSAALNHIMEIISQFLEVQDASHTLEVHRHSGIPFSKYSLDEYLLLIDHATANFVAESFVIGGLLGNVDKKTEKNMRDFGIQLGRLCQIRDDYLDYIDNQVTGKLPFADLYGKRKRFPLLSVFWFGTNTQKQEVSHILSKKKILNSDIYNVIEMMTNTTIKNRCLNVIKSIRDKADQKLTLLPKNNPSHDALSEMLDLFAMQS